MGLRRRRWESEPAAQSSAVASNSASAATSLRAWAWVSGSGRFSMVAAVCTSASRTSARAFSTTAAVGEAGFHKATTSSEAAMPIALSSMRAMAKAVASICVPAVNTTITAVVSPHSAAP